MHELSIARSLLALAESRVPPGHRLACVRVRAGPLQAIDPVALHWAWQAVTADTPHAAARVLVEQLPWALSCPQCRRIFNASELDAPCQCGNHSASPVGGDELVLESIDVQSIAQEPCHANSRD